MIVGAMQPYFMPYIGYFQLMKAVDKYVIADDYNFIKDGWSNRNNILVAKQKHLFSISLNKASSYKTYNEITILDNFAKLKKTLCFNYAKAPFFNQTMDLLDSVFSFPDKQFTTFVKHSFDQILSYLEIKTELIFSSQLEKDNSLRFKQETSRKEDRFLDICKTVGADICYNAIGGQELYSKKRFEENGITLLFLKTNEDLTYEQFPNMPFVPNLSIIDVLMFNSPKDINQLLDQYQLI